MFLQHLFLWRPDSHCVSSPHKNANSNTCWLKLTEQQIATWGCGGIFQLWHRCSTPDAPTKSLRWLPDRIAQSGWILKFLQCFDYHTRSNSHKLYFSIFCPCFLAHSTWIRWLGIFRARRYAILQPVVRSSFGQCKRGVEGHCLKAPGHFKNALEAQGHLEKILFLFPWLW